MNFLGEFGEVLPLARNMGLICPEFFHEEEPWASMGYLARLFSFFTPTFFCQRHFFRFGTKEAPTHLLTFSILPWYQQVSVA